MQEVKQQALMSVILVVALFVVQTVSLLAIPFFNLFWNKADFS